MSLTRTGDNALVTDHQRGLLLGTIGVLVIIPDATLIRLVDAPSLTNAMWRTGLLGITISVFLALRYRGTLVSVLASLGIWGLVASVWSAVGTVLFVGAVDRTSVANVLLILALSPMWAALLSRTFLGERVARRTLVAMPIAVVGVAIAVGASVQGDLNSGDVLALALSVGLAINMTIIRARGHVDMVPTTAIGGFIGCGTLALVGTSPDLSDGDLVPILVLGLIVLPVAMGCLTAAARYLSSPETTLLLLGETAASPILAALVVDEPLPRLTVVGGAVVVATLVAHGWAGLRTAPPAKMPV